MRANDQGANRADLNGRMVGIELIIITFQIEMDS